MQAFNILTPVEAQMQIRPGTGDNEVHLIIGGAVGMPILHLRDKFNLVQRIEGFFPVCAQRRQITNPCESNHELAWGQLVPCNRALQRKQGDSSTGGDEGRFGPSPSGLTRT